MMSLIKILKEVLADKVSKTSFGNTVHYIIESEDKLNSWANTALEHLIKVEVIKDKRYRKNWIDTIRKSFINMEKNSWVSSQNKTKLQKTLLNKLADFDKAYNIARVEFNNKLIKNQTSFPKEYTVEQRVSIIVKWRLCVNKFISGDLDFFNSLDNHLE